MAKLLLILVNSLAFLTIASSYFIFSRVLNKNLYMHHVEDFLNNCVLYGSNELSDTTPKSQEEYDFIIVDAGSAGATIASRLSEVNNFRILLIEAGDHENLLMDVPMIASALQLDDQRNWYYSAEPSNEYCRANNQCTVTNGKVMGGTSSINYMIATRGNKYDYDEWGELTGDKRWSYQSMLKYFKKLETFNASLVKSEPEYHNFNGPVRIANAAYHTPLADAYIKAGEELGFSNVDCNGRSQTGFSYVQVNQINAERLSSNRAYLHPTKGKRNNLFVSINSHVDKILIDPRTKTARGVRFTKYGKEIKVLAKKEVILSAGALSSPKLLMLSGIGPKKHLESFGINVLQDLPVGENMMDHIGYDALTFLVNETVGIVPGELYNKENSAMNDYLSKRTGPMATAGGVEAFGFINIDDPTPHNDRPNVELLFSSITSLSNNFSNDDLKSSKDICKKYYPHRPHCHSWLVWPLLMKPKSRGKLLLRSNNPKDKPKIFPNYLSHPEDLRVIIKAIRKAIEVGKTKAMQRYDSQLFNQNILNCETYEFDSDAYWECHLRTFTMSLGHHSGTCKMGRENDATAIVNTKLQVKGIKNLRVADASVMPTIVSGHLNIPTIAIGEMFSDILKSDYGYNTNS